jgi:hypothetical protein
VSVASACRARLCQRPFDELANGLIGKWRCVCLRHGRKHALTRMPAREAEDPLNEADRAHAARGVRTVAGRVDREGLGLIVVGKNK